MLSECHFTSQRFKLRAKNERSRNERLDNSVTKFGHFESFRHQFFFQKLPKYSATFQDVLKNVTFN